MKVLLDANILISGLRFNGAPRQVLDLCTQGKIIGLTSDKAYQEVKTALLTKFQLEPEEWLVVERGLRDTISVVPAVTIPEVAALRDKKDEHILAAAEISHADIIISGDKDLLILGSYKHIPIINVNRFLTDEGDADL